MDKQQNKTPLVRFPEFKEDWEVKKLGEISKITTGSTPSTSKREYYNGKKHFVSPADIQGNRYIRNTKKTLTELGLTKGRLIQKNNVLFVCIGSTIGKTAQTTEICISNQQINSLNGFKEYNNDFIFTLLQWNGQRIKLLAGIQAIPQINKTDFSEIKLPFPTLPEQQKIAHFFTTLDKKTTHLEEKKKGLEKYKKGMMQQIFSKELRFKDENGNAFRDWEEKKLGEVCSFYSGGTPTSSNKAYYKGNIPFIGSGNIYDNEVFQFITLEALNNSSSKMVEIGDLLYALYGGTSGEVSISKINGAINQAVLCIKTAEIKQYLYQFLKFDKERIISTFLQGGQGNLSAQIIKNLKIKFPSLKEQTKIANFLSKIDAKINAVNTQIEQTNSYKKGLLQRMFV